MMVGLILLLWMPTAPEASLNRPRKYALYKAHTILPDTLRFLVKRHGKHLFAGLEEGLRLPHHQVGEAMILRETEKITGLVDRHASFALVVRQMGYVGGLVAVYTDPSSQEESAVRRGFNYYLDAKLARFLFVFDGYPAAVGDNGWLDTELKAVAERRMLFGKLLDRKYRETGLNPYYPFSERSAVFGVCSLYFSNLARLSALLWYHAWSMAHGDLGQTPFRYQPLSP